MTETQTFGSLAVAAKMRDAIVGIARTEIAALRPETRVAKVLDINTSQLTAKVQLVGDTGTFNARFGYSLMPRAIGDVVRVAGKTGNFYITEILNNSGAHSVYEPIAEAVTDGSGNIDVTGAIPDGGIVQIMLGDEAVGTDNIQTLAVSEEKIQDGAVTVNKLSVVMGGGQMLNNSSFENTATGAFLTNWTVSGTTPTRETTTVHGLGLAAARFVASSVAYQEVTGLESGKVYSVTAYANMTAGATIAPTMRVSDGTGANSQDQTVTVSGQWVRAVARYTANATGKVRVALMGSAAGTGAGSVVWDDVQVERGDIPTAWNPKVTELLPGVINTAMLQTGSIIVGGSDAVVFAPGYDPSTKATAADLTLVSEAGMLQDNYLANSSFDDWPSANAIPTGFIANQGTPVRETTTIRSGAVALRYNVTAGVANYIQPTVNPIGNATFVTVRTDVRLVSGGWGGSGVLVRWYNTIGGTWDAIVDFNTILSGFATGVFWRAETVVPRPSGFTGTFLRCEVWPIGGWTGIGTIVAKNIIFDQLSARPSTVDEIKAWTAGLWAYPGTTTINGGMLQTGTVIADQVTASAINALVEIVGPQIKTQSSGRRVVMRNDGTGGVVELFTGNEATPSKLAPTQDSSGHISVRLSSGLGTNPFGFTETEQSVLYLTSGFSNQSIMGMNASYVQLIANMQVALGVGSSAVQVDSNSVQIFGNNYVRLYGPSVSMPDLGVTFTSHSASGLDSIYPSSNQLTLGSTADTVRLLGTWKAGSGSIAAAAVDTNYGTTITFPTAFPAGGPTPTVMVTLTGVTGNGVYVRIATGAVGRSSFNVNISRSSGSSTVTFDWVAFAI